MTSTLLRLELVELFRGRAVPGGLLVVLLVAVFGIAHGDRVIDRQRTVIASSPTLQKEHQQAILQHQPASGNAGDQLYYLFFHTAHEPSTWAPFSLGQRDVQAFNLKIRILALHGQLYDADLGNPLLSAFGNFDAAFVLVFVAPLIVIALTYDLWSREQEAGTWDLIRAQPIAGLRVLTLKLGLRITLVTAMLLVLLGLAVALQNLPADGTLVLVAGLTIGYVVFWAGLSLVIAGLGRSSDFNLIALVGLWVVLAVLGPALVNVIASTRFPLPEGLELTVTQRQGYHSSWDRPLRETMTRFYERYPEWAAVPIPEDTYSNGWYYAMQQRGDEEAAPAAAAYFATLEQRHAWIGRAAAFLPPAAFQAALNGIARTDLESHLEYLRSVAEYHEQLKRYFFPVIFHESTISDVDWDAAPVHTFLARQPDSLWWFSGVTLAAAAILLIIGTLSLQHGLSSKN